jgi:myo-inositol 2-dehydrogenase/D-chiro-inositol 1-dehydrogenase
MGRAFVDALEQSELWEVSAVYDISPPARQLARQNVPNAAVYEAPDPIFADPSIDVVGLFTLADARPQQIRQALACDKYVLAEKPRRRRGPGMATGARDRGQRPLRRGQPFQ